MADDRTWDAFESAVKDFWPMERELLAVIAELLHSLILITAKANGGKNLPPALRIPRPYNKGGLVAKMPLISMGDFAKQLKE